MANEKPYNRWRDFVENCIAGDNYFRTNEYRELLDDIDGQLARIADLERQNAELVRQLAAQSEDAARYRFAFIESPEWTFAVCKWDGEDWLPIQDNTEIDAAMKAGKENA